MALSRRFKAPTKTDDEQWRKIELLCRHGFRFHRVYDASGMGVRYPATLKEAREFVRRYTAGTPPENYAWAAESRREKNRARYDEKAHKRTRKK